MYGHAIDQLKLSTSSKSYPLAMERLSTSVSTPFKPSTTTAFLPILPTSFKPPSSSNHLHPNILPRRNSLSNQPHQHQPVILANTPFLHKPSTTFATKAASGYAAALLDISLCQNSIQLVFKDTIRLSNIIRAKPVLELIRNPFINAKEKNQALKELIDNGKFEKHFTALLKMLIVKNKFAMIADVLDAFRSMYDELCDGNRGYVSLAQ